MSDVDLLRRLRERDEAALAALYDRYSGLVFSLALRIVGDRDLAEEVMQDAFLRCWNAAGSYDAGRGNVAAWLMRIAHNRAIDLLRSRQHQARLRENSPLPSDAHPSATDGVDTADEIATRHAVSAALRELPSSQRHVVELAYYSGMSQSEIAAALGEPLGTVKSRTRSAMEHLRVALRPQFSFPGSALRSVPGPAHLPSEHESAQAGDGA